MPALSKFDDPDTSASANDKQGPLSLPPNVVPLHADPLSGDSDKALNNAHVSGKDSPEWQALLARPVTLLMPKSRERDAKQADWKNSDAVSLRAWLGSDPSGGLTHHVVRPTKGYFPTVFGAAAKATGYGPRKANGMKTVEFVGLDLDSGDSYLDALDEVEAAGLACIAYTSFNNATTRSQREREAVLKKLGIVRDPTLEEIRAYLIEEAKLRPHIIESVEITSQQDHTEDGNMIVLSHAPLEKFRLLFPLLGPLTITTLAPFHSAAKEAYERKIRGFAKKLGLMVDEACFDVSRVFYMPSHRKGSDFKLDVIRGRGLTVEEMPEAEKAGGVRKSISTAKIADLPAKVWAGKYASRIRIGEIINDFAHDKVREQKGSILVVECPYDAEHSDAGDSTNTGCHVQDADAGADRGFVWACKHGCASRYDRLDMVMKAVADDWFDEALLISDDYLEPLADEDLAEEQARTAKATDGTRFESVKDCLPRGYTIENGTVYRKGNVKEEEGDAPLCQAFDVVGSAANMAGDDDAGIIISFKNRFGVEVEMTLAFGDLASSTGGGIVESLAKKGMRIVARSKRDRDSLLNLFTRVKTRRHNPTVPRPGWVRDGGGNVVGFMPPSGTYIEAEPSNPFRLASVATMSDTTTAGTLEGWKISADAGLSHTANFYWGFGVCAAFVGPLLSLADLPACGFNLSGDSSLGKTLALLLASASWGATMSKKGVLFKMNSTTNAMEDLASVGSEAFLGLDEIGMMANPKDLAAMLFALAEGAGKSRKSGRGRGLAEDAEYRPFIGLTNERTLRTVIENAGGDYKTGISVRFPDISVVAGARVSAAEITVLENVTRNYGHAGPAFVRWLITEGWHKRGGELRKRIDLAAVALASDASPAQGRAAKVFALVQIGGEMAHEAGLLSNVAHVRSAVKTAWEAFLASDEGKATQGESSMLNGFRSWLVRSSGVCIMDTSIEEPDAKTHRERKGWFDDDQYILIADCGFREEWALISRDRGHAFRAMLGSHFTGSWAGLPTLSWGQA